jgi:hypothetical protein
MDAEPTLYEKMVARGVNMSFYEKVKAKRYEALGNGKIAPLDDKVCSVDSIYIWRKNGELWTSDPYGKPHRVVRPSKGSPTEDTFVCVCCKKKFESLEKAKNH